jgi:hypothetical protein
MIKNATTRHDFRRLLKEAVMDSFINHCEIFLGEMRKWRENLSRCGFPAENGRGYHSNSGNTANDSETTLDRCSMFLKYHAKVLFFINFWSDSCAENALISTCYSCIYFTNILA